MTGGKLAAVPQRDKLLGCNQGGHDLSFTTRPHYARADVDVPEQFNGVGSGGIRCRSTLVRRNRLVTLIRPAIRRLRSAIGVGLTSPDRFFPISLRRSARRLALSFGCRISASEWHLNGPVARQRAGQVAVRVSALVAIEEYQDTLWDENGKLISE